MNTYKHSGAFGDFLYSLPIVKYFGGGSVFAHLNQMDWVGAHYYGSAPAPFHQGRMRESDYEFMKLFMLAQHYVDTFEILDPHLTEISHNLDRFRVPFVGHPGNYVDIYADVFGIKSDVVKAELRNTPWLSVPIFRQIKNKSVVINRTARWTPGILSAQWDIWRGQGMEKQAIFVGLPEEHAAFQTTTGWNIDYQPTGSMLELAEYIAGAETFIGNQSSCLALAIGLGTKFYCEVRTDLPINRNECYFPAHPNGNYF
jgi:hypothetical protein